MTLRFPSLDHSAAMGFGQNPLDRLSERRDETAFIAELRADPGARTLLFVLPDLVTTADNAPLFDRAAAEAAGADWETALFLGTLDGAPLFAAPIAAAPAGTEAHNLRAMAIAGVLPERMLGPVAQARAVLGWHATHGFCPNCGVATVPAAAGMRRECPSCGTHQFPRTDPVVIMLAVNGDQCLLGRQRRFVTGMYSCLAGFVEPGETVEAAVRREIWEEAGIRVGRVAYHASQPWPFPQNLMIGCFAEAISFDVDPRDSELDDVRWFPRAELGQMLDRTHPTHAAPPPISISHHLLAAYVKHGAPLTDEAPPEAAAAIVGAMS